MFSTRSQFGDSFIVTFHSRKQARLNVASEFWRKGLALDVDRADVEAGRNIPLGAPFKRMGEIISKTPWSHNAVAHITTAVPDGLAFGACERYLRVVHQ